MYHNLFYTITNKVEDWFIREKIILSENLDIKKGASTDAPFFFIKNVILSLLFLQLLL